MGKGGYLIRIANGIQVRNWYQFFLEYNNTHGKPKKMNCTTT